MALMAPNDGRPVVRNRGGPDGQYILITTQRPASWTSIRQPCVDTLTAMAANCPGHPLDLRNGTLQSGVNWDLEQIRKVRKFRSNRKSSNRRLNMSASAVLEEEPQRSIRVDVSQGGRDPLPTTSVEAQA